jgi:hypothetical protein
LHPKCAKTNLRASVISKNFPGYTRTPFNRGRERKRVGYGEENGKGREGWEGKVGRRGEGGRVGTRRGEGRGEEGKG